MLAATYIKLGVLMLGGAALLAENAPGVESRGTDTLSSPGHNCFICHWYAAR